MNQKEVQNLKPGDIIQAKDNPEWTFIVSQNFGERIIAVRTIEIRDFKNWVIVQKPV